MVKNDTFQDSQRPLVKRVAGMCALMFIMFYLAFHTVSGERGLFALFRETRTLEALKSQLAEVKAQHQGLERKVQLLSDSSLDLDLLDEQVRRVLGMANKNEIVYFPDEKVQPAK